MSQDGNGSGDELYDEESSSMAQFDSRSFFDESNESVASASSTINTGDEPLRRCVRFDSIPTILYYQADEPVFPIKNSFSDEESVAMSQDGSGSEDELYDKESSSTRDEPLRRCVTFDPIPTIFYYQADEPVFPINNSFSRANTPNEQLPRLHRGRRFGSYNNRRAHLYIPNLSTV